MLSSLSRTSLIRASVNKTNKMGALCNYYPLPVASLSNPFKTHYQSPKAQLKIPILSSKSPFGSFNLPFRTAIPANKSKIEPRTVFMDDNGQVNDMEGYLNSLSLEYDSVWDTKPSWCQPWTITLTGVSVVACSWLILHSILVTALASSLIGAWWFIFLYSYPKAYSDMIAERRKRVSSGLEDTFGSMKNQ